MEITTIIILSLAVLYVFGSMFLEAQQNKWFKRGYIEAASKYDESEYRSIPHSEEADNIFQEEYGFDYP